MTTDQQDDFETVTLHVEIEREFEIPADVLDDNPGSVDVDELERRAIHHFWSYWDEFLAEEPTQKNEVSVTEVDGQ